MNASIHISAMVEQNVVLGDGTRVWQFAHIMEGVRIGVSCSIGEKVFIGRGVIIGDNTKIANGANIYEGTIIKNDVFIGNNVSFTNVKYPRAFRKAREILSIIIEDNATIDANAVITAGVKIGKNSTVGAGAVVVRNVSEGGFVVSPAADCICNRDECEQCKLRKEKKRQKYDKYLKRKQNEVQV